MRAPITTLAGRRGRSLLAAPLAACVFGAFCGTALAAPPPQWEVTMTHKNAYAPQQRTFRGSVTAGSPTITKVSSGEETLSLSETGELVTTERSPKEVLELTNTPNGSAFFTPNPGATLSGAGIVPGTLFTQFEENTPAKPEQSAKMGTLAASTHSSELITETIPGGVDPHTGSDENFARESGSNALTITVRNVGGEASTGPVTVEDELPEGVALSGAGGIDATFVPGAWKGEDCEITTGPFQPGQYAGPRRLKCTTEQALAPGESYPPLTLYVQVAADAPESVTNQATVRGGGAPVNGEVRDTLTPTPAVPFGLALYNTSLSGGEAGLAGGHPVGTETNLLLNYTPEDFRGHVDPPGGGGKEIQVKVPPGFVGYVQSLPKCPLTLLRAATVSRCPASTIVGYTWVQFIGQEKIVSGKVGVPAQELLVYNMAPSAGVPAEFGLVAGLGTPVLLEAKANSDGEVTVGTNAAGKIVIADKATFCTNGVAQAKGVFSCRAAPAPSSKPFQANPTQCSGQATWTLFADAWDEPTNYQAKENETPMPALSGCAALQFHPGIEFGPSRASEGGSTQADEPTGVSFNMSLPQAGEAALPATVGQALGCAPGQWTGLPWRQGPGGPGELVNESGERLAVSYQWLRNGEAIAGAATAAYTPVPADERKVLQCRVTASNSGGAAVSASAPVVVSPAPVTVAPVAPPKGILVESSGKGVVSTAEEKTTLLCGEEKGENWTPQPPSTLLSYQWLRNGVPIPGETQRKYTVASADVSSVLQCEVSGTDAGVTVSVVSPGVEVFSKAQPASGKLPGPAGGNALPEITGPSAPRATPQLKNLRMTLPEGMTVSPSAAHGLAACSREQFDKAGPLPEVAPQSTFRPEASTQAAECPLASQIGTLEVFTPLLSGAPAAEGGLEAPNGGVKCTEGEWSGGAKALSYQWLRNGKPIENATDATEPTLAVTAEDENTAIQCRMTARNAGGSSVAVSRPAVQGLSAKGASEPLAPPLPPASIAAPSGDASAGGTLTCNGGEWTGNPPLSYKWLRAGAPIAGASETPNYPLTPADEGQVIQCQVTGMNRGGETVADSAGVIVAPVPSTSPPLPGAAVQGQMFVGQPECSPCSNADAENGKAFPLFIQLRDEKAGVIVKLHGATHVINTQTGRLETVFENQPQQPFEMLKLKLKGGPTAPLANPQSCGTATTSAEVTPWSAGLGGPTGTEPGTPIAGGPGTPPLDSSFAVEGCAGSMPFAPSFNAGASSTNAGGSTNFAVTFGRNDGEQDLSGVTVHMPPGLTGRIPAVALCGEAEALAQKQEGLSEGHGRPHCPAASEIGTAVSLAGPGPDPFRQEGHVYLTGPIKRGPFPSAPFGLVVDTPAEAGPFNLGHVVLLSGITIDPNTAVVTATSEPLPQAVSGVPIRLRRVEVNVTKQGFMLNPTNCAPLQVSATLASAQGAAAQVASPFGITGCKNLPFKPTFTASTQAQTSKTDGASLNVKITYPQGAYANIAKSVTELPTALPSRLTTLQKACLAKVFEANPAACPEGSVIGFATAHTPVLNQPLVGPAYLVSHGGAEFPDLEIILQGEGVMVVLDGKTDIKKGITKTTFNAVPDSPVSTFELNLPEGPHSALGANVAPCSTALSLPTILTGQNGAVIKQSTHIAVIGCPPTVTLTKAKLKGNALLLTLKTSSKGTVKISGRGLKTTKKSLAAGTHVIRVPLTKAGRTMRAHHKKSSVKVSLTVGKQSVVAKPTSVKL